MILDALDQINNRNHKTWDINENDNTHDKNEYHHEDPGDK